MSQCGGETLKEILGEQREAVGVVGDTGADCLSLTGSGARRLGNSRGSEALRWKKLGSYGQGV